ncbi:hypothetical protein [Humisphaera borealis]|uniref:Uncharacterized protein n=1 Tax=Humisphaera borealis TaxID=2807512 RepID=A0A7M2X1M2_9BACT|nr:hypothetical protein [Humisphaera borealis]QOV91657.1 hypothetical protein IPV69_09950 [Humisphaera borealis]
MGSASHDIDAGYAISGSKRLNFSSAEAYWADDGLTLEAFGDDASFNIQEYQEVTVQPFASLTGKSWNQPDVNGESPSINFLGETYRSESSEIRVTNFDPKQGILTVHATVEGRGEDTGRQREFDILMRLRVEERD